MPLLYHLLLVFLFILLLTQFAHATRPNTASTTETERQCDANLEDSDCASTSARPSKKGNVSATGDASLAKQGRLLTVDTSNYRKTIDASRCTLLAFYSNEDHPVWTSLLPALEEVAAGFAEKDRVRIGAVHIDSNQELALRVAATGPVSVLLFHRFLPNDKSHTIYARHEHGPGISFLTSGHLIETLTSFLGNSSGIPALDQLGRQFVLDSIEGVNSRDSIRNKMEMHTLDESSSVHPSTKSFYVEVTKVYELQGAKGLARQFNKLQTDLGAAYTTDHTKKTVERVTLENTALMLRNLHVLKQFTSALFDPDGYDPRSKDAFETSAFNEPNAYASKKPAKQEKKTWKRTALT